MKKYVLMQMAALVMFVMMFVAGCGSDNASNLLLTQGYQDDLANLTKANIPSLFYTNLPAANVSQATVLDAKKANDQLLVVWNAFKAKYKDKAEFLKFTAEVNQIDTSINLAGQLIQAALNSGSATNDLAAAHAALETYRENMAAIDRGNGLDHPLDAIKDFHEAMEPFVLQVKGKTAATLTDADITTLKGYFPNMEATWIKLSSYQFTTTQLLITDEVKAYIDAANVSQTKNLADIKTALFAATPDKAVIATNGNNVKPLFLKLYLSLADFIKPYNADLVAADNAASAAVLATNKTAATSAEVAAAITAVATLETSFNTFKGHFATQPSSISGVLNWTNATTPSYFDKISTAIAAAKTQLAAVQSYPANLTAINTQVQIYSTEMTKLKTRLNYK